MKNIGGKEMKTKEKSKENKKLMEMEKWR